MRASSLNIRHTSTYKVQRVRALQNDQIRIAAEILEAKALVRRLTREHAYLYDQWIALATEVADELEAAS